MPSTCRAGTRRGRQSRGPGRSSSKSHLPGEWTPYRGAKFPDLVREMIFTKLMNALLLKQYMQLEMVDMPVPAIGADDVLVRVRACGICGSDVHGLDGRTGRRIPPLVMGHEAAGEVVEAGSNVTDMKAGD